MLKMIFFELLLFLALGPLCVKSSFEKIEFKANGEKITTTFLKKNHIPMFEAFVPFQKTVYRIKLHLNFGLMSASYKETILEDGVERIREANHVEEFCYYVGSVVGHDSSSAGFSTCQGLKGFFTLFNQTIHVEPIEPKKHKLNLNYNITIETEDKLTQFVCGVKENGINISPKIILNRRKREIRRNAMNGAKVVELFVTNDKLRYQQYGREDRVFESTREIVNIVNLLYQPLGIHVMLVGIELWKNQEPMVVNKSSSGATLQAYANYKRKVLNSRVENDNAYFISKGNFDTSTLGLAGVKTMCSTSDSCGVMTVIEDKSAFSAAIMAHEMGHNFGMGHDNRMCHCSSTDVQCIMAPTAAIHKASNTFSSCSVNAITQSIDEGYDICLHNIPDELNWHNSQCGNGIVEDSEECDCGNLPESECSSRCCNKENCKLKGDSSCAQGDCCDLNTCKTKNLGKVCRKKGDNTCDLEEFCDGRSSFCPKDVFRQNGISCVATNNIKGYCFDGVCQNRDLQCQRIWGPSATDGPAGCYEQLNIKGNVYGFCDYKNSPDLEYFKCAAEDVMCGAIRCNTDKTQPVNYNKVKYIVPTSLGGKKCTSTVADFVDWVFQPSLVYNGSPCGSKKACLNHKCVPIRDLQNMKVCPKCVHGVCNSNGHCHCDLGYGGQSCDRIGRGGSPDSNFMTPIVIPTDDPEPPSQKSSTLYPITSSFMISSSTIFNQGSNIISKIVSINIGAIIGGIIGFLLFIAIFILVIYFLKKNYMQRILNSVQRKNKIYDQQMNFNGKIGGRKNTIVPPRPSPPKFNKVGMENSAYVIDVPEISNIPFAKPLPNPPEEYFNYSEYNKNMKLPPKQQILNSEQITPTESYPPTLPPKQNKGEVLITTRNLVKSIKPPIPSSKLKPKNSTPIRPAPLKPELPPHKPSFQRPRDLQIKPSPNSKPKVSSPVLDLDQSDQFQRIREMFNKRQSQA